MIARLDISSPGGSTEPVDPLIRIRKV